jgi:hypothetical protein
VAVLSRDEFYVERGDHTRIAFIRDAAGKINGAVLNPGPWEQRGALAQYWRWSRNSARDDEANPYSAASICWVRH